MGTRKSQEMRSSALFSCHPSLTHIHSMFVLLLIAFTGLKHPEDVLVSVLKPRNFIPMV